MREENSIELSEYRQLVNAEMKLDMLVDSLLNNADLETYSGRLYIRSEKLEAILMTFNPEGYKNAVEWLKKKGEKDG